MRLFHLVAQKSTFRITITSVPKAEHIYMATAVRAEGHFSQ